MNGFGHGQLPFRHFLSSMDPLSIFLLLFLIIHDDFSNYMTQFYTKNMHIIHKVTGKNIRMAGQIKIQ